MVFITGVWPCGSRRVGVFLMWRHVKAPWFRRSLRVPWSHEDEIEKGPVVPGVRQADEEERQDEGRLPAMEMRGMFARGHGPEARRGA